MATDEVRNVSTFAIDVGEGLFLQPQEIREVERTETVEAYVSDGALVVVEAAEVEPEDVTPVVVDPAQNPEDDNAQVVDPDAKTESPKGDAAEKPKGQNRGGRS